MRSKPGGRILVMAFLPLLFMLGGCVKLDADIVISAQDTVDLTMLLAIQDEYTATVDTFCEQDGSSGTVTVYRQDGYVGCVREVDGAPLAGLSDENLDLSVIHADGQYRFTMASAELGAATGGQQQVAEALFSDFRVAVTFPGEVTAHNGSSTVDGTTVTWTDASDMLSGEGLVATADEASSMLALLPWVGAGLLVAAGMVVGLLLLKRPTQPLAAGPPQWPAPHQAGPQPPAAGPPQWPAPHQGPGHPPQAPRAIGDYGDTSYLDSPQQEPPPNTEPPRNPWGPPA